MRQVLRDILVGLQILLSVTFFAACGTAESVTLQDDIREYIYRHQPTTGEQFVAWASKELGDYSPRQVFDAIQTEGKFQAELGHPNSVGVLSFAAKAWADRYDFQYDPVQWITMQQEATKNLRSEPGTLQLWPTAKP